MLLGNAMCDVQCEGQVGNEWDKKLIWKVSLVDETRSGKRKEQQREKRKMERGRKEGCQGVSCHNLCIVRASSWDPKGH